MKMVGVVLMPPTSPQWAVAEVLMWRTLVQLLIDAEDRQHPLAALVAMARVIKECGEAIPMGDQPLHTTIEDAASKSSRIIETLCTVVPPQIAQASMRIGFEAAEIWRRWNAEEAADGMDAAQREMEQILKMISNDG